MKRHFHSFALWFALLTAACGGGGSGGSSDPTIRPLKVASTTFADGAIAVDPTTSIVISFDSQVGGGGITTSHLQISYGTTQVPVTVEATGFGIVVTPTKPLKVRTDYRLVLRAGARADSGGVLSNDFVINFRTAAIHLTTRTLFTRGDYETYGEARAADLNGDGRPDVVVAERRSPFGDSFGGQHASVYIQEAGGSLRLQQRIPYPVRGGDFNPEYRAPVLMDIDGDGIIEILVSQFDWINDAQTGLLVYKQDLDGVYQALPFQQSIYLGTVTAADVDGDGRIDLIGSFFRLSGPKASGFQIFLNQSTGLVPMPPVDMPFERAFGGVSVGDLDRDGKPELLVLAFPIPDVPVLGQSQSRLVYSQRSPGVFELRDELSQLLAGVCDEIEGCRNLSFIDIDGDGWLDLLAQSGGCSGNECNLVVAYLRQPNAGFVPGFRFSTGLGPADLTLADLDRDGLTDCLILDGLRGTVGAGMGQRRSTFEFSPAYPLPLGTGGSANAIVDFDGDGRPDVLMPGSAGIILMQQANE